MEAYCAGATGREFYSFDGIGKALGGLCNLLYREVQEA